VQQQRAAERVAQYFRIKQRQLRESAQLAVCDHQGLAGSHREEFQRIYLREILPQRFSVGRGMVYGIVHRSREADIVVWDGQNYPRLPMSDHSFFFAESVRAVIECKSTWSRRELVDVLSKSKAVRDILPVYQPTIVDDLQHAFLQLEALRRGIESDGFLAANPHISTAGVFIDGGGSFSAKNLTRSMVEEADDSWPDLLLLLEPGRLVVKKYSSDGAGQLWFYELGDDALLGFTGELLARLWERSVQTERFYFDIYGLDLDEVEPASIIEFPLLRFQPFRTPLWRAPTEYENREQPHNGESDAAPLGP
jgi:hypothetical protein